MNTIVVHFEKCKEEDQQIIIAILSDSYNVEGFEEKENDLYAYFLTSNVEVNELEDFLKTLPFSYKINIITPQNWNALWESNFEPVVVDDFCGLRAVFHEPIPNVQHELVITPKMSFGTGHHATTFQVIKAMQNIDFKGRFVCDFGTGTGVLAILAEKLGASKVLAIDNDDWSIENSKENILINNCFNIDLQKAEQLIDNEYDIVLANINKNVLLASMPSFKKSIQQNGILILSGILQDDFMEIHESLQSNNFVIIQKTERNNWLCLKAVRN